MELDNMEQKINIVPVDDKDQSFHELRDPVKQQVLVDEIEILNIW